MLRHPEFLVEQMSRDEADGDESSVISIRDRCEDDLLKSVVEISAEQKYFLPDIDGVITAVVQGLLSTHVGCHVLAVIDSQEWVNFALENHEIQNDPKRER